MLKNIRFLLFTVFLLTSCSHGVENEGSAASPDENPSAATTQNDAAAIEAEGIAEHLQVINRPHYHTIEIRQMKFIPEELMVSTGDTVVWINNGITTHDVTELPNNSWTSSPIAVGASWSKVITQSTDYYCSIHMVMKGKLRVQ